MSSLADLEKLASKRRRVLRDENNGCTIHIKLSEPVLVWKMDRPEIQSEAEKVKSKRCDFSARQIKNPNDGKTHLLLIECKKSVRVDDEEIDYIHKQLKGGLKVLRYLAGGSANLPFDRLTTVLVIPKYFAGGISNQHFHQLPIPYKRKRNAYIKVEDEDDRSNGLVINDNYVAERSKRR